MAKCRVCDRDLAQSDRDRNEVFEINCSACGHFFLTLEAYEDVKGYLNRVHPDSSRRIARQAVAHKLRVAQRFNRKVCLQSETVEEIVKHAALPDLIAQSDNLMQWLSAIAIAGAPYETTYEEVSAQAFCFDDGAARYLLEEMQRLGLLNFGPIGRDIFILLQTEGWRRVGELKRASSSGFTAFMAMKFGDRELDALVNDHVRPAVAQTGLELIRLDDRQPAGLIDDQMRVRIRNCRLLISDLSHQNAGAYWEAGYAEGLGKPVVYTCRKDVFDDPMGRPHFDTNHHLTVVWQASDPTSMKERLKAVIRATLPEVKQTDE